MSTPDQSYSKAIRTRQIHFRCPFVAVSLCFGCCAREMACSCAKLSYADEGGDEREVPLHENVSSQLRTRVMYRNAGVDARFPVVASAQVP